MSVRRPPERLVAEGQWWEPPELTELQALLPQYEILELLGRGGMGAVYKARQLSLRRLVAIKVLPGAATEDGAHDAERFKQEAFAMAQLSHPGIVNVYDAGEVGGRLLYFVMEYVEGHDLARELSEKEALPQEEVKAIALQLCAALGYLHSRGVVHRDVKPANILLQPDRQVKVADFGVAKLDESLRTHLITRTGTSIGTEGYMAPECQRTRGKVDHRADLFSLGVIIYQMLLGHRPHGMFKLPSQINPALAGAWDEIIWRSLEPDPGDRFQIAGEMQAVLERAGAAPDGRRKNAQTSWRRVAVFAGLIALAAIAAGLAAFSRSKTSPTQAPPVAPARASPAHAPGVIDLLALLDLKRDVLGGTWERTANGLSLRGKPSESKNEYGDPRVELPYVPPEEFDFEVEFTPDAEARLIGQIVSARGKLFSWLLAGGTGLKSAGFELLDSMPLSRKTETTAGIKRVEADLLTTTPTTIDLMPGRRYRSRVEVRTRALRGLLDEKVLVDWGGSVHRLGGGQLRNRMHLGVRSLSPVTFHKIIVREITGKGRLDTEASAK